MRSVLIAAAVAILIASSGSATELERILLPVTVGETPGAFGSLWYSEIWVHAIAPTYVYPLRLADILPLQGESLRLPIFRPGPYDSPGQFIFVNKESLSGLSINIRVMDLSRSGDSWGTGVPVVREADFRTGPIALLPIPSGMPYRQMLRVYGTEPTGGSVMVHVVGIEDLDIDRTVELTLSATTSDYLPAYAELNLGTLLQESEGLARVDVSPVDGIPIWAFVTVTSNDTQQVTIVSP